jgi:spermidine/putrescine transport system permease protein
MHASAGALIFRTAAVLIFAFLYLPIVVLMVFSFQDSRIMSWPIDSWSLRWYAALLDNRQLKESILNSLKVATSCVVLTTCVGVPLALALRRLKGRENGSAKVSHGSGVIISLRAT